MTLVGRDVGWLCLYCLHLDCRIVDGWVDWRMGRPTDDDSAGVGSLRDWHGSVLVALPAQEDNADNQQHQPNYAPHHTANNHTHPSIIAGVIASGTTVAARARCAGVAWACTRIIVIVVVKACVLGDVGGGGTRTVAVVVAAVGWTGLDSACWVVPHLSASADVIIMQLLLR